MTIAAEFEKLALGDASMGLSMWAIGLGSWAHEHRDEIARGLRMQASVDDPRTPMLVRGLARRLAQTPHTGDEEQDTATYDVILADALAGFRGAFA